MSRIDESKSFAAAGDDGSWAGRRIGPYKLFRELGRGGMAVVYLAGRVDDVPRQVAIKVIQPGPDREGVLRRFEQERRILARLDHPNIARLLDGGTTEGGEPYLVMEYVEGEPLDAYCDRQRLSIEKRLELFNKLCAAVHYAHRNLVVHRDLKPSNILVSADGELKLLDFGVAKVTRPELVGLTVALTAKDLLRFMTARYASPEQVRDAPITTASDVYSLGILLYELLTGHRAYRFASYLPQEIERVICEVEPERPSAVVVHEEDIERGRTLTAESLSALRGGSRPEGLRRRLSGDLDKIVLMAMRKEPQRRYDGADQLAGDIRRHLEGLPVTARPATFAYRTGKFVRRHKLAVAFVILLAAFAVGMTVQSARIARQRDHAELQRARAEEVSEFLVTLFDTSDRSRTGGEEVSARQVLEGAAAVIEEEFEDQPLLKAMLMHTMGRAYFGLGDYRAAADLGDRAVRSRRTAPGAEPLDLADSLVLLGRALDALGDHHQEVRSAFEEALQIRRRDLDRGDLRLADSLNRLALLLAGDEGSRVRVRGMLDESLEILERHLPSTTPAVFDHLLDVGSGLLRIREYPDAESVLRRALEAQRRLRGSDHIKVAETLNELAQLYDRRGRFSESKPMHRELLPIVRRIYGEAHPVYAQALKNQAFALHFLGEHAGAEAAYRESLRIFRAELSEDNRYLAGARSGLAALLTETGEFSEAGELIRRALAAFRKDPGTDPWRIRYAESTLAACLVESGNYEDAEALLLESYRALSEQHGPESPYVQLTVKRLVTLYEALGRSGKAADYRALLVNSGASSEPPKPVPAGARGGGAASSSLPAAAGS